MSITDILFFSIEVTCFFTAVYYLRNDHSTAWRLHRWYLGIVIFFESGALIIANGFHQSTHSWYNIYIPIECAFISWFLFYCISQLKPISKWWLYGWYIAFFTFYLVDILTEKQYILVNDSIQLMNGVLILGCLLYYYLLQRSTTYRRLSTFADFWWVNGVMYFRFSTMVLHLFLLPQLGNAYVWGIPLFYLLNTLLIVILYSTWIYAYFLRYRERKTYLASSSS